MPERYLSCWREVRPRYSTFMNSVGRGKAHKSLRIRNPWQQLRPLHYHSSSPELNGSKLGEPFEVSEMRRT